MIVKMQNGIVQQENEKGENSFFFKTKDDMSVTDCGVIEHLPDLGHWGLGSDILFEGLRN